MVLHPYLRNSWSHPYGWLVSKQKISKKEKKMKALMQVVKGFIEGVKTFGEHMNASVVSILLVCAYSAGIGISFIIAKIFGKKFLEVKIKEKTKTYWSDIHLKKKTKEEYLRQF